MPTPLFKKNNNCATINEFDLNNISFIESVSNSLSETSMLVLLGIKNKQYRDKKHIKDARPHAANRVKIGFSRFGEIR